MNIPVRFGYFVPRALISVGRFSRNVYDLVRYYLDQYANQYNNVSLPYSPPTSNGPGLNIVVPRWVWLSLSLPFPLPLEEGVCLVLDGVDFDGPAMLDGVGVVALEGVVLEGIVLEGIVLVVLEGVGLVVFDGCSDILGLEREWYNKYSPLRAYIHYNTLGVITN
jgi:hypothetical protein